MVQIKILTGGKVETTQGDEKQAEKLVQKDLLQRNKDKGDKAHKAQDEVKISYDLLDYLIVRLHEKDIEEKYKEMMVKKEALLQRNRDEEDKAHKEQGERMIAQELADYIIREVRARKEKKAEENKTKAKQDMVEISAGRLAYMERTIQRNEELRCRNRKLTFKGNNEMPKKPGLYWAEAKETGRWPFTDAERIVIAMVSGVPPMLFVEWVFPYGRLSVVDAVTVQTKDRTDPARIEWGPKIEMPEGLSPDATVIPYTGSVMATLGSKVKTPID